MSDFSEFDPLIRPPLDTSFVAQRVLVYDEVESTNDYALRLGGNGTLVIAERQTSGRGRLGRSWHSARGLGLWFSLGFDGHIEGLQIAAAISVRDALRDDVCLDIKWPNDLLLQGRKLCGILVEHRGNRTAVGIGINVLHAVEDFPPELRERATSLLLATGRRFDRAGVLKRILKEFEKAYLRVAAGRYDELHQEWVIACDLVGKRIRWGTVEGIVVSIDKRGALNVETSAGEMQLLNGDITTLEPVTECSS